MPKTILLGILVVSICSSLPVCGQSVFVVDRLTDTGDGEGLMGDLRYCISNAMDGDVITFGVIGTINLSRYLPSLSRSIRIEGPGANLLTVRRESGGNYRIFTVISGTVRISGLTIANGWVDREGGGVYNGGTLTVSNTTISGNRVQLDGGGVYNLGTLIVSDSTISGNDAHDGRSYWYGGGVHNSGTLTVTNSTISGNRGQLGGGVYNQGTLTVSNSTISDNHAWGEACFFNCFETGYGGGFSISFGGSVYMRNTILSGNSANRPDGGHDLAGTLTSSGYNLIGDTRGGSGYDETDLLNINPLLGPLQGNGGPTLTHALLPGSPAIDAGDPDFVAPRSTTSAVRVTRASLTGSTLAPLRSRKPPRLPANARVTEPSNDKLMESIGLKILASDSIRSCGECFCSWVVL